MFLNMFSVYALHMCFPQKKKLILYMDIYVYIRIYKGVLHPEWNYISLETASAK